MLRRAVALSLFTLSPASAHHVDAIDWPTKEAGMARFATMEYLLGLSFERLCGDTFCEDTYANLRPMQLSCSVDARKGTVRQCLWMFSGSSTSVHPKSGAVRASSRVYACRLPIARDTPVDSLYEALHGAELLHAKLPMTHRVIYDSLRDCLR
ncbi:hypothetical protein [Luteibacter yeojuensis]|uniref:Uncharacterized protein n=1 Tax=Luteibacter yeojuensis TaxID=345309 RepID=A0A7X5TS44_9GAMM|nr:hypothetical protein [Luteibacter yeojuensis]NID17388.1 hypothetical protein [Luteibacter yeojuensis]